MLLVIRLFDFFRFDNYKILVLFNHSVEEEANVREAPVEKDDKDTFAPFFYIGKYLIGFLCSQY